MYTTLSSLKKGYENMENNKISIGWTEILRIRTEEAALYKNIVITIVSNIHPWEIYDHFL